MYTVPFRIIQPSRVTSLLEIGHLSQIGHGQKQIVFFNFFLSLFEVPMCVVLESFSVHALVGPWLKLGICFMSQLSWPEV